MLKRLFIKKQYIFFLLIFLIIQFVKIDSVYAVSLYNNKQKISTSDEDKLSAKNLMEKIYNERSKSFVNMDIKKLNDYYDTSHKYGRWALEHEIQRIKYLNSWAYIRNIKIIDATSKVKVSKVVKQGNKYKINLKELCKFTYKYNEQNDKENIFFAGLNHGVTVVKKDDKYIIVSDWYTDCFEDALKKYSGSQEKIDFSSLKKINLPKEHNEINAPNSRRYNREKAIEYADKYCGISASDEKIGMYNKRYGNYTGIGGDCTNFASQVLGDKLGGNLKFDGSWHCEFHKYGSADGSKAWVNADAFKSYLMYSGKGSVVAHGNFKKLAEQNDEGTALTDRIRPGDLVCYAKGSDIDHFAIITGRDSHGYPLVNSHTTDRYHVPWDLGWGDKDITFYLIRVN